MKCSALNVDFNGVRLAPLGSEFSVRVLFIRFRRGAIQGDVRVHAFQYIDLLNGLSFCLKIKVERDIMM